MRSVEVFDGKPEELALLMPDQAGEHSGFWRLGYVYDAGRTVALRCKYSDAKLIDMQLTKRVARCDYRIATDQELALACR